MKHKPFVLAFLTLAACGSGPSESARDSELLALGIRNAVIVEPELASAGQPTPEQFAAMRAAGWTRVISLRPADEDGTGWEEARAEELGIDFVRIPVSGESDLTEAKARALGAALEQGGGAATLVCCASGNRVGGLLALKARFVDDLAPDAALAFGKRAGLTKAEPAVRVALGLPAGP